MTEEEIEELARDLRQQYENTNYSTEEAIAIVIRETLFRVQPRLTATLEGDTK